MAVSVAKERFHLEPYELSQDLIAKQLEVLEKKYGGSHRAKKAALTIQRAFRRYSMEKKFALLTAQMKSEKRFSRRMEYRRSITVSTGSQQSNHPNGANIALNTQDSLQNVSAISSFPAPQHHSVYSYHGNRHGVTVSQRKSLGHFHNPATGLVVDGGILRGGQMATSSARVPVVVQRHSASCRYRERNRGQPEDFNPALCNNSKQVVSVIESQAVGNIASDAVKNESTNLVDSSNNTNVHLLSATSGPSLQSFPLDETCVYNNQQHLLGGELNIPSSQFVVNPSTLQATSSASSTASSSPRIAGQTTENREASPHGSQQQKHRRTQGVPPPNVPRRTVSRLTSAEIVNNSNILCPAISSPESSSTIITLTSAVKSPQPKQSPSASISSSTSVNSTQSANSSHHSSPQTSNKNSGVNSTYQIGKQHSLNIPIHNQSQQHKHGYLVSDVVDCRIPADSNASVPKTKSSMANNRSISQVTTQQKHPSQNTHLYRSNSASSSSGVSSGNIGVGHSVAPSDMANAARPAVANNNVSVINNKVQQSSTQPVISNSYTVNEVIRKRHYRTGLNIFNKKPEKGITYLIRRGFLENSPQAVARFLITRKGLSKQMIGEYLGNLMYAFNMAVLGCFANEVDFAGMPVDAALRKFQTYFRMPGEAQKIERLMEIFSARYCQCNPDVVAKLNSSDTLFILAFAIILLNTDLHTPNIKAEKRMKLEDFVRNLRNIDDGHDLDLEMLSGIYERIKSSEFRPGSDHVTQVMKVQQTIVAKCPNLALPHRRLVCYCRLYEVNDPNKKERPGLHQREVFLFNDILVITKIHSRKKNTVTYSFRQSYLLAGLSVTTFETQHYPFGIKVTQKWDRKLVLTLNARNEHDRTKFVEDMKESIAEMDEMETLRLESELEKQRLSVVSTASTTSNATNINNNNSKSSNDLHIVNRDSGITGDSLSSEGNHDLILRHPTQGSSSGHGSMLHGNSNHQSQSNGSAVVLRKSAINNSLLDLTDASEKMARRGSVGSLDSGMSISFVQSGATPSSSNTHTHRHSGDGQSNHHSHHHQQHTSRAMGNGANMIHPVVGTCKNCMNPVAMPLGGNNHNNACYHHLHHHHYHHHNHHLQPDYQHRHHNISVRQTELNSSNSSSGNSHSSNTVASITSAML